MTISQNYLSTTTIDHLLELGKEIKLYGSHPNYTFVDYLENYGYLVTNFHLLQRDVIECNYFIINHRTTYEWPRLMRDGVIYGNPFIGSDKYFLKDIVTSGLDNKSQGAGTIVLKYFEKIVKEMGYKSIIGYLTPDDSSERARQIKFYNYYNNYEIQHDE